MPKAVFAVTNVKISADADGWFPAGSRVDVSKFTKEQLVELHDVGAIEIRVIDEEPVDGVVEEAPAEPTPEQEGESDANSEDQPPTE